MLLAFSREHFDEKERKEKEKRESEFF